jgi:hypothetical protein
MVRNTISSRTITPKAETEDDFDEEEAKDIQKLRSWSGNLYILTFNIVD